VRANGLAQQFIGESWNTPGRAATGRPEFPSPKRTAAARLRRQSNGVSATSAANAADDAAGAGDKPETVRWIAAHEPISSFKAGRAKPKVGNECRAAA